MRKISVLIVDDSVVVRRILSDVLTSDPGLEVCGIAQDGQIGLSKIEKLQPDLVVLDLEMPRMDGLQTLGEIRRQWPLLPVIMYSSLTQRGAAATLDALALGASDYLTKPSNVESPEDAVRRIREELIPKIKAFCRGSVTPRGASRPAGIAPAVSPLLMPAPPPHTPLPGPPVARRRTTGPIGVVVVGTSTGGPNALADLLPTLPGQFPVPMLIVQHMPPIFTRLLAERLATRCAIPVTEAVHGERILPGHVYIAPGDYHLAIARDPAGARVVLNQDPRENSCRPAADVLFRTAAAAYPGATLGVLLTGLGSDGTKGSQAIRESGGLIYAQDEASSVVWGMPGSVVRAGYADQVLPLDVMGHAIASRAMETREAAVAVAR